MSGAWPSLLGGRQLTLMNMSPRRPKSVLSCPQAQSGSSSVVLQCQAHFSDFISYPSSKALCQPTACPVDPRPYWCPSPGYWDQSWTWWLCSVRYPALYCLVRPSSSSFRHYSHIPYPPRTCGHQSWLRHGAELSSQGQGLVQKMTTVRQRPFRRASVKESSVNPQGCGGLFLQHPLRGWIVERRGGF